MAELKPCPFCGGYTRIDHGPTYFREHLIYCEGCDMYFALDAYQATEADLIEAFNRRVVQVNMTQNGSNNTCIHNVGALTLNW